MKGCVLWRIFLSKICYPYVYNLLIIILIDVRGTLSILSLGDRHHNRLWRQNSSNVDRQGHRLLLQCLRHLILCSACCKYNFNLNPMNFTISTERLHFRFIEFILFNLVPTLLQLCYVSYGSFSLRLPVYDTTVFVFIL